MTREEREQAVDWFAERLKETLRQPKNEAKGGWRHVCLWTLLNRGADEYSELFAEVDEEDEHNVGNEDAIISEACDVAAFCMMIADRARLMKSKP